MKRITVLVILFMAFFVCAHSETEISANSAILMEFETGRVLFEKNADERAPIASTTKVMTCLLALENSSLSEIVTAGKNASGVPGTSIYLAEGEKLTMEQLLYGLMLRSGNDAAVAIAEHIAGSTEAFAEMMNGKAEEFGVDAYFTTPNGLDEGGNGATARALCEISRIAMRNPEFRKIVQTKKKTIPWVDHEYMRVLTNKNKLLSTYDGALGIKTGYTSKAGRCLAFAAERDGMTVIGAVLRAPDWFNDAKKIMDEAFETYSMHALIRKGECAYQAEVKGAGGKYVSLQPEKDVLVPVKEEEKCEMELRVFELEAPIRIGQVCGEVSAIVDGKMVITTNLVAMNEVDTVNFLSALRKVACGWPMFPLPEN